MFETIPLFMLTHHHTSFPDEGVTSSSDDPRTLQTAGFLQILETKFQDLSFSRPLFPPSFENFQNLKVKFASLKETPKEFFGNYGTFKSKSKFQLSPLCFKRIRQTFDRKIKSRGMIRQKSTPPASSTLYTPVNIYL